MGRFGTDAVALATIAGAAVVGGIGTAAVLGANANHGHQHEDRFEYEMTDSRQFEISTRSGEGTIVVTQGRRGDREMRRRRRHRHPHRINEARSRMNEARFERLRFRNEFNSSLEHRIQAELAEAQAAVEAEMAQIEFAVEVLEDELEAKVNR